MPRWVHRWRSCRSRAFCTAASFRKDYHLQTICNLVIGLCSGKRLCWWQIMIPRQLQGLPFQVLVSVAFSLLTWLWQHWSIWSSLSKCPSVLLRVWLFLLVQMVTPSIYSSHLVSPPWSSKRLSSKLSRLCIDFLYTHISYHRATLWKYEWPR